MRLTITLQNIGDGFVDLRLGDARLVSFTDALRQKELVIMSNPIDVNGRKIGLIAPIELQPSAEKNFSHRFFFKPVWNRCMVLCHVSSKRIKSLIIESDYGQVMIDAGSVTPCKFTIAGQGCDPNKADESVLMLRKLLENDAEDRIVVHASHYLCQKAQEVSQ